MVLTLDCSQTRQHRWTIWGGGAAAEQTPPSIVGWRNLNCDFMLKIY